MKDSNAMSVFPPELDRHPLSVGPACESHPNKPNNSPMAPSNTIKRTIPARPMPPYHLQQ